MEQELVDALDLREAKARILLKRLKVRSEGSCCGGGGGRHADWRVSEAGSALPCRGGRASSAFQ